jgi:hypothetical protein
VNVPARRLILTLAVAAVAVAAAVGTAAAAPRVRAVHVPPFPKVAGAWWHVDINVRIGRRPHTLTLDRGRITQISATELTLHEADGSNVVVPLIPTAIVQIHGRRETIYDLRRRMFVMTMRIDGGPAVRIRTVA